MSEVRIGDRTYVVGKFSAFKVLRASRIVGRIMRAYPEIALDDGRFVADFERFNTVRITRAMAKLPRFAALGLEPADFEGRDAIEFPTPPPAAARVMNVFPKAVAAAEADVMLLFALMLASNTELEEHDDAGDVDEWLVGQSRKLAHRAADAGELVDVAVAVAETLREQFGSRGDSWGKLLALFTESPAPSSSATTTTASSPGSSTDSPEPTDGPADTSSTVSSGASSKL
jgi:hypothetical protein